MQEKFAALYERIAELSLGLYIVTLFCFVDRESTVMLSRAAFVLFAACSAFYILLTGRVRFHYYLAAFAVYILYEAFTLGLNADLAFARDRLSTLAQLLLMAFLTYNFLDSDERIRRVLGAVVVSSLVMYALILMNGGMDILANHSLDAEEARLGAEVNQINTMGFIAAVSCVICVWFALFEKKRLYLVPAGISLLFAVLSGSRKSILVICVGVFGLLFLRSRKNRALKVALAAGCLLLGFDLLAAVPVFRPAYERLNGLLALLTGQGMPDDSTLQRQQILLGGWQAFLAQPWFGHGIVGTYLVTQNATGYFYSYLHNNYIELLVNGGVIGFAIYYSFYARLAHGLLLRRRESIGALLAVLLLVILFSEIAVVTYYDKFIHLLFAVMAAYAANKRAAQPALVQPAYAAQRMFDRLPVKPGVNWS